MSVVDVDAATTPAKAVRAVVGPVLAATFFRWE